MAKGMYESVAGKWNTIFPVSSYIIIVIVGIAEYFFIARNTNLLISFIGGLVFLLGVFLRDFSIKTLGDSWSIHVKADHVKALVIKGPYRYLNHPYYIGSLITIFGFLLIPNSYHTVLLVLFLQAPLYIFRMRLEEIELKKRFGTQFLSYKRRQRF